MKFEMKIVEELRLGTMPVDAIINAATKFPALFDAYIERVKKAGEPRFEDKVRELLKAGVGKTMAFERVMREFPGLYDQYLRHVHAGEIIIFNS
jgi:hypothetical protein